MTDLKFQMVMLGAQTAIALAGFIGAFMLHRLIKAIEELRKVDAAFDVRLMEYREDMLKNYVRHEHLGPIKQDIIGRVDRFETCIVRALAEQEQRQVDRYWDLKGAPRR